MDPKATGGYAPLYNDGIALNQTTPQIGMPPQTNPGNVVVVQPGMAQGGYTSTTTIIQQQPQTKRPWSSNTCDCFQDMRSCCCTLFFGSYYLGCVAQRMGEHCCVGCGLPGLWPMRSAFRERHNIQGDLCDDCCMIYWCGPCVACQLVREMNSLGYPADQCC